jgi:hypothetical protein
MLEALHQLLHCAPSTPQHPLPGPDLSLVACTPTANGLRVCFLNSVYEVKAQT